MKETTMKLIPLEKLIPFERNPREQLEAHDLVPSLSTAGLQTNLLVRNHPTKRGFYQIAQGHRRREGISLVQSTHPESFETHFGDGVKCDVMHKDTTEVEFILAVADHGDSRALTTDYELYMLARLLFEAGIKRDDCIRRMQSVLATAKPFKNQERTRQVNELTRQMTEGVTVDDRNMAKLKLDELIVKARTGLIQRYYSVFQMPEIVEASFEYISTGNVREGFEVEAFPAKLTESQIKALYSSKTGYLKDIDNGNKDSMPLFKARWQEVMEAESTPSDTKKARSRKEVKETADAMDSGIAKVLLGYACNESGVGEEKVRALDEDLQMLEWLKAEKAETFTELKAEFRTWAILRDEALASE